MPDAYKSIRSRSWLKVATLLVFLTAGPASAQDLDEALSEVGGEYARAYVDPLGQSLGAGLNTGLFHLPSAGTAGVNSFRLFLGIQAMATYIPSSEQRFDLTYEAPIAITYTYEGIVFRGDVPATLQVTNAPTVFGNERAAVARATVRHDTSVVYLGRTVPISIDTTLNIEAIGGLIETNYSPLAVPHLEIGRLAGTDVMLRWLPAITVPDYGSVRMFGAGVRNHLDALIPGLPFGLSVYGAYQEIRAENEEDAEVASVETIAAGVRLSASSGLFSGYADVQYESSDINVQYEYVPPVVANGHADDVIPISFDLQGRNRYRFSLGGSLNPGPFYVSGDVGFSRYTTFSAAIGLML